MGFFFPAGISQRGERPASSPSVPAPGGKQPRKGWHRAPGRMGSPRRSRSARVEQQGLTRGGDTSPPRAPEWHPGAILGAGRTQSHGEGRGALPGGAQPPCSRILLRSAPRARTRLPPRCFPRPHPTIPAVPVLGGAAPHPIPSPSPGSAPAGRTRPRRGTKSKLPGTSSPWLGAAAGGVVAGTPRANGTEGLSLVAFCPFPARWRRGNSGGAAPRSQSPPGGTGPRVNRVRPGAAAAQSAPALGGGDF